MNVWAGFFTIEKGGEDSEHRHLVRLSYIVCPVACSGFGYRDGWLGLRYADSQPPA